jgi:hypothetical protein
MEMKKKSLVVVDETARRMKRRSQKQQRQPQFMDVRFFMPSARFFVPVVWNKKSFQMYSEYRI